MTISRADQVNLWLLAVIALSPDSCPNIPVACGPWSKLCELPRRTRQCQGKEPMLSPNFSLPDCLELLIFLR